MGVGKRKPQTCRSHCEMRLGDEQRLTFSMSLLRNCSKQSWPRVCTRMLYVSRQIATRQLGSFFVCGLFALPHNLVLQALWPPCSNYNESFSSLVSTGSVSQAQTCLHKLEHGCHALTLEHQKILLFDHDFSVEYWTNIFNIAMFLEEDGSRGVWVFFFYVGDAGNTSLVDAGTPLGATAVVTPGVVRPHQGPVSHS